MMTSSDHNSLRRLETALEHLTAVRRMLKGRFSRPEAEAAFIDGYEDPLDMIEDQIDDAIAVYVRVQDSEVAS